MGLHSNSIFSDFYGIFIQCIKHIVNNMRRNGFLYYYVTNTIYKFDSFKINL